MDKLRMQSSNGIEDNITKIAQLFPDCVTETVDERSGQPKHLIDFEKLKQNLSDSVMSERAERYQFTWPDKSKAILLANSPINATLRPCREDSVDFDNTQNLYIEGDNLDVLKCLKETYLHKVKMIYIDPPYNTGNDFVYEDDFAQSSEEYLANSGQFDEQGNRMFTNAESKELIEKAIAAINKELVVSKLSYVVTRGVQKTELKHDDMKAGSMMVQEEMQHDDLRTDVVSTVKYDLLGKIATNTRLTRKTIAGILSQIKPEKFDMYKMNPEEFIRRVSRLILEQKATIIVDHISYNEIEGSYDSAIFTEEKHTALDKAYQGRKSIVDYVFTDGTAKQSVERKFVEDLDSSTDVAVYAKLPKGFHIPTPVGNYSPDWAIAFKDGAVKHVYFVAETKGSMSTLDLRGIEDGKIACADRLFEQLSGSGIYYHKVTNYDDLMEWVK